MTETPAEWPKEWVEMAWAARNAACAVLNEQRRRRFESVKALLRDGAKVTRSAKAR
jgi:hypothetical protein